MAPNSLISLSYGYESPHAIPILLLSIMMTIFIILTNIQVNIDHTSAQIFTTLVKHPTGVIDICTSTCYLTNKDRLHKLDLDNKSPWPFAAMLLSGNSVLLLSGDSVWQLQCTDSQNMCKYGLCYIRPGGKYVIEVLRMQANECFVFLCNAFNLNVSYSLTPMAGVPEDDWVFLQDIVSPTDCFEPGFPITPEVNTRAGNKHTTRPPAISPLTYHHFLNCDEQLEESSGWCQQYEC